jgi:hypothetical protein
MLTGLTFFGGHVCAQTMRDLAGTYTFVSETREKDGTKIEIRAMMVVLSSM